MVTNRNRKSFGSRRKSSKSYSDDWHRWRFWSAFRHFGSHFVESFPFVQIFMNDGPNPFTWYVQLHSYWFSRNPAVFSIMRMMLIYWKKNTEALVVDNKEVRLLVNADKNKYMVMSRDQYAGWRHNIKTDSIFCERVEELQIFGNNRFH